MTVKSVPGVPGLKNKAGTLKPKPSMALPAIPGLPGENNNESVLGCIALTNAENEYIFTTLLILAGTAGTAGKVLCCLALSVPGRKLIPGTAGTNNGY